MSHPEGYAKAAELTYRLLLAFRYQEPRFAFPPKEIALIADLRDVAERLARNDSARAVLALVIHHCVKETGQAPTAMMLRICLEEAEIPIETVSLSDLGLSVGRA